MARTDHVLSQVAIAPDDQAAANRDDFDTARAAGNAAHMARPAHTGRCGGLDASRGCRGSETTLRGCAALVGRWLVTNNLSVAIKLSARGAGQWVAHSQLDSADWMERAARPHQR